MIMLKIHKFLFSYMKDKFLYCDGDGKGELFLGNWENLDNRYQKEQVIFNWLAVLYILICYIGSAVGLAAVP
jgi:hypothetical protein